MVKILLKKFKNYIFISLGALSLTACASTDEKQSSEPVSTIPWNRPEHWEGQGVLGGFPIQTN